MPNDPSMRFDSQPRQPGRTFTDISGDLLRRFDWGGRWRTTACDLCGGSEPTLLRMLRTWFSWRSARERWERHSENRAPRRACVQEFALVLRRCNGGRRRLELGEELFDPASGSDCLLPRVRLGEGRPDDGHSLCGREGAESVVVCGLFG